MSEAGQPAASSGRGGPGAPVLGADVDLFSLSGHHHCSGSITVFPRLGHPPIWPRSWAPITPGGAQPFTLDPFQHPGQSDFGHASFSVASWVSQRLSCK